MLICDAKQLHIRPTDSFHAFMFTRTALWLKLASELVFIAIFLCNTNITFSSVYSRSYSYTENVLKADILRKSGDFAFNLF